ncbi:hypothetical protein M5X11_33220 [Paenibacillus alginolyticus]|uniref:Uncharacterized protein n=1 Tax=Paenibacillus alginolyticus TaxID=59839 RepID=A0ABT4G9J5_9BACL|nr:hypothetical protein [Paenibacillus alginolyticus]MCY9669720.1 hypothetical protein [Paenibacillus alginolyticus]MCY9692793.1 hypothetical protein [Paenibacillus alginolyticus]MEC0146114.1 hypothetical protein [Paenibacillus alginolyticus]
MNSVQDAKKNLALSTKRGIPLIISGILFWILAGVCGSLFPQSMVLWVYIFGVGLVFPIGILIAKIMKIDIIAKGNPLGNLAATIGSMQILFAPIIITLYFHEPAWIPFVLGVLNGAHFLPYVWVYNSKTYLLLSLATVVVATVIGLGFLKETFLSTPFCIAAIYLVSAFGLRKECSNDLSILKGLNQ